MGELVRLIVDTIAYVWCFRIVKEWERAGRLVCGRWVSEKGPGWYWNVPFFMEIHEVSVAEAICGTNRQDITCKDGSTLSFSASVTARVVDVKLAVCSVDDYASTTQELLASVLAERLADVDADRLKPENRRRLMTDLTRWVAEEAAAFGVQCTKVRFTSFLQNARCHRLVIDQASPLQW